MTLIYLIMSIIWSFICYKMAESRDRNAILGAILGFLFGLIAVIGYAIVGDKESE